MKPVQAMDRQQQSYAALLRGINVGGHRKIKMAELKAAFVALGCKNVKTVLASGNVRFDSAETDAETLRRTFEQQLAQNFGYTIGVIVRTVAELQSLRDAQPFREVAVGPQAKLYVTFLPAGQTAGHENSFDLPSGYAILRVTARDVCSALSLSQGRSTIDLMAHLEKHFGPNITTRTWNTVTRLLAAT